MARAGNGQELGHALDEAQNGRHQIRHDMYLQWRNANKITYTILAQAGGEFQPFPPFPFDPDENFWVAATWGRPYPNDSDHVLNLRRSGMRRGPMGASGPTVPRIIKALKGLVTREAGHRVWQDNYHEHIIRDDNDFLLHWRYIDQNPARWNEDEYYAETAGGAP